MRSPPSARLTRESVGRGTPELTGLPRNDSQGFFVAPARHLWRGLTGGYLSGRAIDREKVLVVGLALESRESIWTPVQNDAELTRFGEPSQTSPLKSGISVWVGISPYPSRSTPTATCGPFPPCMLNLETKVETRVRTLARIVWRTNCASPLKFVHTASLC